MCDEGVTRPEKACCSVVLCCQPRPEHLPDLGVFAPILFFWYSPRESDMPILHRMSDEKGSE